LQAFTFTNHETHTRHSDAKTQSTAVFENPTKSCSWKHNQSSKWNLTDITIIHQESNATNRSVYLLMQTS